MLIFFLQPVKVKVEPEDREADPPLPQLPGNQPTESTGGPAEPSTSSSGASTDRQPTLPIVDDSVSEQTVIPAKKKKSAISDLFGEVFVTKVEPAKSVEVRVDQELVCYKSEGNISLDSDPLAWWKSNQEKYPILSKLAKTYLCIPATSVASERIFSTAGDVVTAQRSCLSADQVDMLIFLKKNYKI